VFKFAKGDFADWLAAEFSSKYKAELADSAGIIDL
jgi:hypothetical protein